MSETCWVPPLQSATSKTSTAQQRCLCLAKQDMKDFTPLYIYRWMGWKTEEAELRKRLRQSLQSKPSDLCSRARNVREPGSVGSREGTHLALATHLRGTGARRYRWVHTGSSGAWHLSLCVLRCPQYWLPLSLTICRRRAPKLYNNAWLIVWLPSPTSPLLPWEEGSRVCVLVDL